MTSFFDAGTNLVIVCIHGREGDGGEFNNNKDNDHTTMAMSGGRG